VQGFTERQPMQLIPGTSGRAKISGHRVRKAVIRRKNP